MDKLSNEMVWELLRERFGDQVQIAGEPHGLLTVVTTKEEIIQLLTFAKEDERLQFSYLTDITAVHYPEQRNAFAIVYHLHNLFQNLRLRVKVFVDGKNPVIPTATTIWNGANWMERETYDFFGVKFERHPDLRRIPNMDDIGVFPMRKEYPLEDPNRVDKKDFYFGR
jgi:NADH-quinone oxidoreductase subunit C